MNEKNMDKVLTKEKALRTVEKGIKAKEEGVFAPEIEFEGEKYPNTFVVGSEDVLASEVKGTDEFKAVILGFKGNPDFYDSQIASVVAKNGRIKKQYDWEAIKEIKTLEAFDDEAKGQIFFYARALVLRDKLNKEIKKLKN